MNKQLLIFFLLLVTINAFGQENRYIVFFADKGGNANPYSLDRPEEFLTDKSIIRREKQGIALSEADLPVNPNYITQLKDLTIDVHFTSRWMNAALIQTDAANESVIASQSFVDSLALIAEGARLSNSKIAVDTAEAFAEPPSISSSSAMQLAMLQADVMHREGIRGENMTIAVLDDGFLGVNQFQPFEHLWNGQIIATRDFVENSGNVFRMGDHGTSVLSTIAAQYQEDYFGTAYNADLILCITEEGGSEDRVEEYNWLLGAEFADSLGADVINSSLGYRSFDIPEHNYSPDDLDGATAVVSMAARMAADRGMLVVVSAGNSGDHSSEAYRYI